MTKFLGVHLPINPRMGHRNSAILGSLRPPRLTLDRSKRLTCHAPNLMLGGGRERGLEASCRAQGLPIWHKPHTRVKDALR